MRMDWLRAMVMCAATSSMAGMVACGEPTAGDEDTDASSSGGAETEELADSSGGPTTAPPGTASGEQEGDGESTADPPADTTDTGEDTTTGEPPPGDCQPVPTRMVVLGDSIPACVGVGGKDSDDCAPKRLNDHLAATYGPLTYENLAVGGAVTSDVSNDQIFDIEVGVPGHVIVMIYIGGNDLAQYMFLPDQTAMDGWMNTTGPEVAAAWEDVLDFLGDPANFPDGVTLLMNTQYNPFDDCTAPPYFISETKIELLHAHNQALMDRAASREWAFIADQHPSYLGHGHYVNDASCPHYDETFEGWMGDLIHPNTLGHQHLGDVMAEAADLEIYGGCE